MWCRTILTAVAITYVLCMLLWSGLQKEDLDAKTLEKLNRHNVNIGDMNNEQLRQECMSEHVTTEVNREVFKTFSKPKGIENYVKGIIYPKIEMLFANNFEDKAVVQHEVNNNKSKDYFDPTTKIVRKMPDLGNVTKVEGDKATIKIEYDLQNQHDLESVMNVWTKLTRSNTTVMTTLSTTTAAPAHTTEQEETPKAKHVTTTAQAEIHNNDNVHYRDMEYMSRMFAKYLISQTVTTTERVLERKEFPNDVQNKYWNLSNKASIVEKPNRLNEQRYAKNKSKNIIQDDLHNNEVIYNSMLGDTKGMSFGVTYDSVQLNNRIQGTRYNQIPTNEPNIRSTPVKKNNEMEILLSLLQMKNELYNNGVLIPESESTSETIKLFTNKSNEQQDKRESFNLLHLFPFMNFVNKNVSKKYIMNNDGSTTATTETNTWESVRLNENINKEFKVLLKDTRAMSQVQKLYNQFKAAPPHIITRQITTYDDETIVTTEPEQVQMFNTYNNRILGPPDIRKSKFYQNSYMEDKEPWFQVMLPLINYRNTETTYNEVLGMGTGFNKLDQNENIEMVTDPSDAFKADSGIVPKRDATFSTISSIHDSTKLKSVNNFDRDNEQHTPINVKGLEITQHVDLMNMHELQAIQPNIIKEIAEKVKRMVLKQMEVATTTTKTTTSIVTTTSTTTTSTTAAPTTETISSKASTSLQQEFTQTNQVIQKLMEIFKELKAVKETVKLTNQVPEMTTTVSYGTKESPLPIPPNTEVAASSNSYLMQNPPMSNSQVAASSNSYLMQNPPISNSQVAASSNSYLMQNPPISNSQVAASSNSYLMQNPPISNSQVAASSNSYLMQNPPISNSQVAASSNSYLMQNPPISNSQVAASSNSYLMQNPPISNSQVAASYNSYLMQNPPKSNSQVAASSNSYIMQNPPIPNPQVPATSKSYIMQNRPIPMALQAKMVLPIISSVKPPQNNAPQYMPPSKVQHTKDYHLGAITMQTNSDEIAPLAIQLSKPLKLVSQNIVVTTTQSVVKLRREEEQNSIKHIEERLRFPTEIKKLQHQSDFSTKHGRFEDDIAKHESRDHNFYKSKYMNREKSWYNHEYNNKVHDVENKRPDMSRFPELHYQGRLSHLQHFDRPRDLNILNNFEELNHPREINRPNFKRPESQQNGVNHHSYSHSGYDHQPRYEPTKFHEILENIEDRPQTSWKGTKTVLPSDSNYDEISGRQQMSLTNSKHRTSYNDSHFTNFLKSQQKVTDMLEKILANNVKNSGLHSVETL